MTFAVTFALIIGGIGLLMHSTWATPVYLVATGMLLYTVINSPGYFAQRREWPLVVMFVVLLILTIASLLLVISA